jgi:hypothetical protein
MQPRMRGLSRYAAVESARRLQSFLPLAKECNARAIPIMLLKGGAVSAGYLQGTPRVMGDIDIGVQRKHYATVIEMARDLGFSGVNRVHSIDLSRNADNIDLHCRLCKTALDGDGDQGMWERSEERSFGGVQFKVPSPEDLIFQIMADAYADFVFPHYHKGKMRWMLDVYDLSQARAIHWQQVEHIAQTFHLAVPIGSMMQFARAYLKQIPDHSTAMAPSRLALYRAKAGIRLHGSFTRRGRVISDRKSIVDFALLPVQLFYRYVAFEQRSSRLAYWIGYPLNFLKNIGRRIDQLAEGKKNVPG